MRALSGTTYRNQRSLLFANLVVMSNKKLVVLFGGQQVYQSRACNTFVPRQEISIVPEFGPFLTFLFNGGTVDISLVLSKNLNHFSIREEVLSETLTGFSRL